MKPKPEQLLYFDAEWTPITKTFESLKEKYPDLAKVFDDQIKKWVHQREIEGKPEILNPEMWWQEKAHFYPEFSKIICVSYGYFSKGLFLVNSLYGEDEKRILSSAAEIFKKANEQGYYLCGYSIKRFDMPWLSKRMMINGISPPSNLSTYGKKPWDIQVFDLPEVWGQGNMQESYTPFEVACTALGLETSKGELSGDKVKEAYWNGEIERIKNYCEKDVTVSKNLAVRLIDLLPG